MSPIVYFFIHNLEYPIWDGGLFSLSVVITQKYPIPNLVKTSPIWDLILPIWENISTQGYFFSCLLYIYIYISMFRYVGTDARNRDSVVVFQCTAVRNLCVNRISLTLSFPSTWTQLLGLPPHSSQYLCYWIVVANGNKISSQRKQQFPSVCIFPPPVVFQQLLSSVQFLFEFKLEALAWPGLACTIPGVCEQPFSAIIVCIGWTQ